MKKDNSIFDFVGPGRNGKIDNCTIASAPLGIEFNNEYLTRLDNTGRRREGIKGLRNSEAVS